MRILKMIVAAGLAAGLLASCTSGAKTETNASGDSEVVKAGDLGAFDIKPGNCLVTSSLADTAEVSAVPAVPCSNPHDAEVTALVTTSVSTFDDNAIAVDAEQKCQQALADYIGVPWSQTTLETYYLTPTKDSWDGQNDREIACMAWDPSGSNLSASVKGAGADYPLAEGVGKKNVEDLVAGDCLASADQSDNSAAYFTTPCTSPHDLEIVGVAQTTATDFDEDALNTEASDTCTTAFKNYVGVDYSDSELSLFPITPNETTWDLGDRTLACVAKTSSDVTASIAGTAQ